MTVLEVCFLMVRLFCFALFVLALLVTCLFVFCCVYLILAADLSFG